MTIIKLIKMNRIKLLLVCMFLLTSSMEVVLAQEKLNEFVITPDGNCPFTIRPGDGEYGFVVINTTLSDLRFTIPAAPRRLVKADFNSEKQQWILTIVPNDNNYKRYRITVNSDGFKQGEIGGEIGILVKQKESLCFDVNPKYSSALEKLARITVYDKDNKILVGAVVKNKTTGRVYGSTRYDGTLAINFDNKGESANVIVSHPSYSDTKEITVQAGGHDYKVYLRNYNPSKGSKTPRVRKLKPEKFTMELSAIGGSNLGVALDFTASYFLIGLGIDWMILAPEQTVTTPLDNSGYTGTFTKTTTMNLTGSRTNVFFDIGTYFKYFSLSCQVGLLCGTTIKRTSLYDGWGYGLVDGDLNEYWGTYEHRSFSNTTSDKETHLTITPQVKGYIPVGSKKTNSLSIGLGYTIIPTLNYNPGLSGSLGVHFRF